MSILVVLSRLLKEMQKSSSPAIVYVNFTFFRFRNIMALSGSQGFEKTSISRRIGSTRLSYRAECAFFTWIAATPLVKASRSFVQFAMNKITSSMVEYSMTVFSDSSLWLCLPGGFRKLFLKILIASCIFWVK